MKKIVIDSKGVASFVGQDDDRPDMNKTGLINAMTADLSRQAQMLHMTVDTMPHHTLRAALNAIFWKHKASWPGSEADYQGAYKTAFRQQLARLDEGKGLTPGQPVAADLTTRTPTRRELRGKLWGDIVGKAQELFHKHPDKLERHELETLKLDVMAMGNEQWLELRRWLRSTGRPVTAARMAVRSEIGQSSSIPAEVLSVANKIEDINSGLRQLSSELQAADTAWLTVAGKPAVKLMGPQAKIDGTHLRFGNMVGTTFIPAWDTDLSVSPLLEVRKEAPGLWTVIAKRDNDAMLTINLFQGPTERSVPAAAVATAVAARDPWDADANEDLD